MDFNVDALSFCVNFATYDGEGNTASAYTLVSAAEVLEDPEAVPGVTGLEVSRRGDSGSSLSFTVPVASLTSALDEEEGGGGLNLVFARGSTPTLGYHGPNKACFKIG